MEAIVAEMSIGLEQEHSSIIHCYRCWLDRRSHCINLITEFFTSGNLRDYRQRHKHLELKAVKKWARQVGPAVIGTLCVCSLLSTTSHNVASHHVSTLQLHLPSTCDDFSRIPLAVRVGQT